MVSESPSEESDVSDNQAFGRKKVALSRSSRSHPAFQNGPPLTAMRSRPELRLPGLVSWSKSLEIPTGPDDGQHDVKEEVVREYVRLLDYRIVSGKPFVLVPWRPTWNRLANTQMKKWTWSEDSTSPRVSVEGGESRV